MKFELSSEYQPRGDQPKVIQSLVDGIQNQEHQHQVLLGVTGSGKTFTMANVIAQVQRPTLVLSHNKTLAAQLASEFKTFFPNNAVEYFVSYYDYYQPEAYVPQSDTYIEKDASINEQIDRLRHSATHSLLTRRDVIIVASVSCIYGLGSPEDYENLHIFVEQGEEIDRKSFLNKLIQMRYERNDLEFVRGKFRVRGETIDIFPAYEENRALRLEFFGDELERIVHIDPLTGEQQKEVSREVLYPASHYAIPEDKMESAIEQIEAELERSLQTFEREGKALEAQRLKMRTDYDIEMMRELGYCSGIENYSRFFSGRQPGEAPYVLLDYFDKDMMIMIDESHATVPQVRAMYEGDRSRKSSLINYGFRLPSALDNRPLKFTEFERYLKTAVYVSATPAVYEIEHSQNIAEQIIRPTGLMDPEVSIRPIAKQVSDVIEEVHKQVAKAQRTLITTLTKKMSEDLTKYLQEAGISVQYIHSDVATLERLKILKDLRQGKYDVLVGVNLLREGLDMPEVSLVAILDADKEGFLRNERSLIQTMGRAARNVEGRVILYADKLTESIEKAVRETERRRKIQAEYNQKHGITPQTVQKAIKDLEDTSEMVIESKKDAKSKQYTQFEPTRVMLAHEDSAQYIIELEEEMRQAAGNLEFEKAAQIRDKIKELEKRS